jgi:hypothetical protein
LGVNQLSAVPLIPSVRISLAAVSHKFGSTRLRLVTRDEARGVCDVYAAHI